jgi:saccharopine dehydrogenase-like NADP-dependent oxidoreductase
MRNILLIGAGKTTPYLVKYLSDHSKTEDWEVTVADANIKQAEAIVGKLPNCKAVSLNVVDENDREPYIKKADIVISSLPSSLHIVVAQDCVKLKKHLLNASYVSPEIKGLHDAAKEAGILFLSEMGVDPGIDHMSAMALINNITGDGGKINVVKSYTGGLIAPESDDNPWNYKITWNPRKIVLAGQGTAHYKNEGVERYIPAHRVFGQIERIKLHNEGVYDAYINRDSLKYRVPYGIEKAHTVIRGTLRHKGFCKKWNCVVNLGLTDDSFIIEDATNLTYKQFAEAFLPAKMDLDAFLWRNFEIEKGSKEYKALDWLGLMSNEKIGMQYVTPAQILQKLIEKKWKLKSKDKDMIVMYHEIHWSKGKKENVLQSSLEVKGENQTYTAMAKTVGLPLAIATKLILQKKITQVGVRIPVSEEIYQPVLSELEQFGIKFKNKESNKKKGFAANFKLF